MALSIIRSAILAGAAVGGVALALAGCQMARQDATGSTTAPAPIKTTASEMGGAELWSVTCSHCHNLRSPSSYGPAQWEVAVYDMRVRAHLTGEEQRKILAFLKA